MKINWFFPEENSPGENYNNSLSDSKFNIEKWASFVREIVQNSSDNPLNKNSSIKIKFDLRNFTLEEIPGGPELREIISKAINKSKNSHIRSYLESGLKKLNSHKISCLKISDFNTKGIKPEREGPWGALVFDDGVSVKDSASSGGSHGVGKKVHYLASSVNTVFYSSLYHNALEQPIFQGSSNLSLWIDDNSILRSSRGWFGLIDENLDRKNKVKPLIGKDILHNFNEFFYRENLSGTDVIVVAPNFDNDDLEDIKKIVSLPLIDNFFTAIYKSLIEFDVFGELINSKTINKIMAKYYINPRKKQYLSNLIGGNAGEYLAALSSSPASISVIIDGISYGNISLYFLDTNNYSRKHYAFVRMHGMKIQDYELSTDQAFTAVLHIDNEILNEKLKLIENTAHDDFVLSLEKYSLEARILKKIRDEVENYIQNKTKIEIVDNIDIEFFGSMIGSSNGPSVVRKEQKIKVTRQKIKRKSKITKPIVQIVKPEIPTDSESINKSPKIEDNEIKSEYETESKTKGESTGILVDDFDENPTFYIQENGYLLKFKTKNQYPNCYLEIFSINNEGKINKFENLIESAYQNEIKLICEKNLVFFSSKKEEQISIRLNLIAPVRYQLFAQLKFRK